MFLVFVTWFAGGVARCAEMVDLTPMADTTLIEAAPTNNLGAQTFINSGTTGPNAGLLRNRALLRFDPAGSIPRGSLILSAQLTLEVVGEPDEISAASTYALHRVLRSWGEGVKTSIVSPGLGQPATLGEATWHHRHASTTSLWAQPGGEPGTDFAVVSSSTQFVYGPEDSPYEFPSMSNLVADVQAWIDDPNANHGWILLTTAETTAKTARRFGSREGSIDAPRLRIAFLRPPKIDRAGVVGGHFELEFTAVAGQAYRVEAGVDVGTPSTWGVLTNLPAPPVDTAMLVRDAPVQPHRFYRVAIELP